jgi:hypothetical protein
MNKESSKERGIAFAHLLANQVGQIPRLLPQLYNNIRAKAGIELPALGSVAIANMWAELGSFYLFLTGARLAADPEGLVLCRNTFYDLLTTEWLVLDDGIRVPLPHLSEPSLRQFHAFAIVRYREYVDALEAAGGLQPGKPDNEVSRKFVERVLGVDVSVLSPSSRFALLLELHGRMFHFLKMMDELEKVV